MRFDNVREVGGAETRRRMLVIEGAMTDIFS